MIVHRGFVVAYDPVQRSGQFRTSEGEVIEIDASVRCSMALEVGMELAWTQFSWGEVFARPWQEPQPAQWRHQAFAADVADVQATQEALAAVRESLDWGQLGAVAQSLADRHFDALRSATVAVGRLELQDQIVQAVHALRQLDEPPQELVDAALALGTRAPEQVNRWGWEDLDATRRFLEDARRWHSPPQKPEEELVVLLQALVGDPAPFDALQAPYRELHALRDNPYTPLQMSTILQDLLRFLVHDTPSFGLREAYGRLPTVAAASAAEEEPWTDAVPVPQAWSNARTPSAMDAHPDLELWMPAGLMPEQRWLALQPCAEAFDQAYGPLEALPMGAYAGPACVAHGAALDAFVRGLAAYPVEGLAPADPFREGLERFRQGCIDALQRGHAVITYVRYCPP
ncbi:MAG: hypothetical protein KTR31_03725 [Myxococcales bacterium]|nr:hypothetical protein [Myxococcales bacterium]